LQLLNISPESAALDEFSLKAFFCLLHQQWTENLQPLLDFGINKLSKLEFNPEAG